MGTVRQATKKSAPERSVVRVAFKLTFGPLIWALHLAVVYGVHSFGCARGLFGTGLFGLAQPSLIIVLSTVLAVVGIAGGAAATVPARIPEQELSFERAVGFGLAGLSLFGVLAAGAAALVVPACAGLR